MEENLGPETFKTPSEEADSGDGHAEEVLSDADPTQGEASATEEALRSGTVALVGRPNAGKSTLMNHLLPEKLAIVSNKPQTTRHRMVGILSEPRGQIVFYDTPGVHKPQHSMNRSMLRAASEALIDADLVCLLVDVSQSHGKGDEYMLEWLGKSTVPKIALLNKVDLVQKQKLLPRIARYAEAAKFHEIIPISALREDGTDQVLESMFSLLPSGPPAYDPELLTVHPERFLVAERIREKVLMQTAEELPFSTAVVIDDWQEKSEGLTVIYATILAEREGQKKILVGSGGSRIKSIGAAARQDLEAYLDCRVYLDLKVRVEKSWRDNRRVLGELDRSVYAAGLS